MLDRARKPAVTLIRGPISAVLLMAAVASPLAAAEAVSIVVDRGSGAGNPRVTYCWAGEAGKDPGPPAAAIAGTLPPPREFGLGDLLSMKVANLKGLVGEENEGCDGLRLSLSRNVFRVPRPYSCNPATGVVTFNLERISQSPDGPWSTLLDSRRWISASVDVSLATGAAPDPAIAPGEEQIVTLPTDARGQQLKLINKRFAWIAIIGLVVVLAGFFYLASNSQMLRDQGKAGEPLRTYSLARTQTAWWFLIIVGSFLFLSLLVGEAVTIPLSALGLMGISAGTVVGAQLVDSDPGDGGAARSARGRKPEFWRDILSDETGVGFHRFQMAVWTAALGAIFVIRVFKNLAMPEFDSTLLGLMGISNGTYLGMKIPESRRANAALPTQSQD